MRPRSSGLPTRRAPRFGSTPVRSWTSAASSTRFCPRRRRCGCWCRSSAGRRRWSWTSRRSKRSEARGGVMKKVVAVVKLQIPAGKATPAPPVGPALGQHGVNIMEFCKSYNEKTAKQVGTIVPVEITVYADRTFTFVTKTPPASVLLKKAAGLEKGSGEPNKKKVGKVTHRQIREIAETKLADLNTKDLDAAMRMIEGTARSMGIEVGGGREADARAIHGKRYRHAGKLGTPGDGG